MISFADQVVLITGAGSGLGRQLALLLAQEGARIIALDINAETLQMLASDLKGRPLIWEVADVTDRAALFATVQKLEAQAGSTDLLIASAGVGYETAAVAFQSEAIEAIVRVNLVGVANSIEAVLRGMVNRRRGHLTAISSLASYRGLPHMAGYCASKAGLNALMDSLRIELKRYGIRVTTICPGWVRTPLTARLRMPLPGILEVEDAAQRIIKAIRRGRPFAAFPRSSASRLRLLSWLPCQASDWLLLRSLKFLIKR